MKTAYLVEYQYLTQDREKIESVRPQHIAYRKSLAEKLLLAGPLLDNDVSIGSVVLLYVEGASYEKVLSIAEKDPYVINGVCRCISARKIRIAAMQLPQ